MKIIKKKYLQIEEAIDILSSGGLVVFPTETTYGIAADALNPSAIKKLNRYKKRPAGKPYSVAVTDVKMAEEYAFLNRTAKNIYRTLLPGPVTVISKGKHKTAPGVESESGTLGIRIPDYKLVTDIVKKFGRPITATSANASYKKRPYKISDIVENLTTAQKKLIGLIIDAGELPHNEPSTVVDTTYDDITVLRQGDLFLKNKIEILSRSEEETKNLAKDLWQKYEAFSTKRAIVFALTGEMGTGKTVFTKGLAKAMGITSLVTSPTYNLINSYFSQDLVKKLIHIDVWRISDTGEISDLDISKEISNRSVLAIEWSEKISGEIRKYSEEAVIVWVKFENGNNTNDRIISWGVAK